MATGKREKPRLGRPPVDSEAVKVRMVRAMLDDLDAWIAANAPRIGRPEAVRRILAQLFAGKPRL